MTAQELFDLVKENQKTINELRTLNSQKIEEFKTSLIGKSMVISPNEIEPKVSYSGKITKVDVYLNENLIRVCLDPGSIYAVFDVEKFNPETKKEKLN